MSQQGVGMHGHGGHHPQQPQAAAGWVPITDPRVSRFLDRGTNTGMRLASVVRILFLAVFGVGALVPFAILARDLGFVALPLALVVVAAVAYVAHISITKADRKGVRRLFGGMRPWSAFRGTEASEENVQVQAAGTRGGTVTQKMTVQTMRFANGGKLRLHPATQTNIEELVLYGNVAMAAAQNGSVPESALPAIEHALSSSKPSAGLPFAALGFVVLAVLAIAPYSAYKALDRIGDDDRYADIRDLTDRGFTNDQAGEILRLEDEGMSRDEAMQTVRAQAAAEAAQRQAEPEPVRIDHLDAQELVNVIGQRGLSVVGEPTTEGAGLVTRVAVRDAQGEYTVFLTSSGSSDWEAPGAGPETEKACRGMADHVVCATGEGSNLMINYELGFDSGANVREILVQEHDYRVREPREIEDHGGYQTYAMVASRRGVNVPVFVTSWAETAQGDEVAADSSFGKALIVQRTSASGPSAQELLTRIVGERP